MLTNISRFSAAGKASLLSIVLFTFAWTGPAQTPRAGVADQASQVKEFEVNGLKVLVKSRDSAPTVAAGLFVRGGARNITSENAGIESFMLNVATEASKKYPRDVVRREIARTGSSIGGGSGNDFSAFSLVSTLDQFERTWDIFTDLIINPTFDTADVERIRDGILAGLKDRETNPDNLLQVLQDRAVYANHPYANDVGGTIETIGRLTAKDLRDYHKKIMQTSQLLLIVVGDIDADDFKSKISATLGKLPKGKYKEIPLPELDFSKGTLDIVARTLPTNYVQGVFSSPSLSSPDYSAMRVAMTMLQGSIYREVRLERQLSYAPTAEMNSLSANTANIYVTAEEANKAVEVMLKEVENLKDDLVDEDDIKNIGGHFLTLYYLDQETNVAQARELAKYELIGGGWRNSFQFLNGIREVKPKDIQRVAKKYIKNIRFVVVGDPKAVDRKVFLGKGPED